VGAFKPLTTSFEREEIKMIKKTYQLETLTCPSCTMKLEGMLKQTEGVEEYEVFFNTSKIKLTYDESIVDSETIKNKIARLGFEVLKEK
jgi:copper chaperone CopZ